MTADQFRQWRQAQAAYRRDQRASCGRRRKRQNPISTMPITGYVWTPPARAENVPATRGAAQAGRS